MDRPNLQKALTNTGWLFGDKLLRMGVGLLVGVWIARYLGPEQFGLMNYAMAIVALFGAVASLGLNGIVVRDLVQEPDSANTTLGTAFLMQFIGGFLAFGLAIAAIGWARPGDSLARLVVAVLGFVMVFKATEVVKYWFESQVKSKYVVWMENGVFLALAVIKVGLILIQAPLMAFVWTAFAEGALGAVGLLTVYAWRGGALGVWRIRYGRAKTLLINSWPLILSSMTIMIYMRIDQIMLGYMVGDEAVGIYSAAVRVSEVWYFIPMVILPSLFPSIVAARNQNEGLYRQRMQKIFDLVVLLAFIVAIPMTLLAKPLVTVLFGAAYVGSATPLAVLMWSCVFVFFASAWAKGVLAEGRQKVFLLFDLSSVSINVALNFVLIPRYGVTGAAIATAVSVPATYVIAALLFPRSEPLLKKLLKAIFMNSYILHGLARCWR